MLLDHRTTRWPENEQDSWPYGNGKIGYRERQTWREDTKMRVQKRHPHTGSRGEAQSAFLTATEGTHPASSQSQTSGLQNCESISFYGLNGQACGPR